MNILFEGIIEDDDPTTAKPTTTTTSEPQPPTTTTIRTTTTTTPGVNFYLNNSSALTKRTSKLECSTLEILSSTGKTRSLPFWGVPKGCFTY